MKDVFCYVPVAHEFSILRLGTLSPVRGWGAISSSPTHPVISSLSRNLFWNLLARSGAEGSVVIVMLEDVVSAGAIKQHSASSAEAVGGTKRQIFVNRLYQL